jgi:hypothetical protein
MRLSWIIKSRGLDRNSSILIRIGLYLESLGF